MFFSGRYGQKIRPNTFIFLIHIYLGPSFTLVTLGNCLGHRNQWGPLYRARLALDNEYCRQIHIVVDKINSAYADSYGKSKVLLLPVLYFFVIVLVAPLAENGLLVLKRLKTAYLNI